MAKRKTLIVLVSILVSILTLAFIFAVTFIIPKFATMFVRSGVELPLITRMLFAVNTLVTDYWYLAVGGLALVIYLSKRILATQKGRLFWDGLKLKLPVFGTLFLKNAISRFTHMLETLNSSGIHIIEALQTCSETTGNAAISLEIDRARAEVEIGASLADALDKGKLFPSMMIRMIRTGQDAGSLDDMLISIYNQYDEDVDYLTKRLLMMVVIGVFILLILLILFIALGIFLPMWGMYEAVK